MPPGTLQRQARKLDEKIDGHDVYHVDLVNDDLDRVDELTDDYAELERQKQDIDVDDTDTPEERAELRAQVRGLTRRQRALDSQMLGLYVEDKDGNRFDEELLAKVPVRVQTKLIRQATEKIYGGPEGPTPAASANA